MAKITYRLPGREQYSYVEVELDLDDLLGPDAMPSDQRVLILDTVLADLNQVYPQSAAAAAPHSAPSAPANPKTTCVHGPRKHAKGTSAKGPWQAYFCPHPDKATQCQAVWVKQGEPEWVY